jgi:HlyD family secretion protein
MKPLFAVLFTCLFLLGCRSNDDATKNPVVAVTTQKVSASNVALTVSAPASVFGKTEAHLSSRITASVEQVLVHKGETVRKGQLLASLDKRDLAAQSAAAVAATSSSETELQRTQGGTIPVQLTQARGEANARAAALELAQKVFERRKVLFEQGAISGRELQVSEADLAQAKANADAAQKNLEVIEKRTSVDDLRLAQNSLAQSKARQDLAGANLSFADIRSPVDGTVTDQMVFPGDLASPGSPMFTVMDLSSAVARAQVDADKAGPVRVGQTCSFYSNVDLVVPQNGRVTAVNQAVDPARRAIEVWCEIPNAKGLLKAGVFGRVEVFIGTAQNAIVVPSGAVEMTEGTTKGKLYVVDAKNIAHVREVEAQPLDDGHIRVLSGLHNGETIVTIGEYGLPDGTAINPSGAAR